MPAPRRQADRSEATRRALLDAGRTLFAERGYAAVGTEEVVRAAQVTRGALYHHFTDKRDLFRAVFEDLEGEMVGALGERILGIEDPLELLREGVRAFLELSTQPTVARIALVDAPSVLGWAEWREIDMRHGLGLVKVGLQRAMDEGVLQRRAIDPLAHLLTGALGEAGMLVAHADDPARARAEVEPELLALLDGLRA